MECAHTQESSESQDKIIQAVVLHRHGARGPSAGALKPFSNEYNTKNTNTPYTEWEKDQIDMLTDVGLNQMEKLGEWFATTYNNNHHILSSKSNDNSCCYKKEIFWRCSIIERVQMSGRQFWKGYCKSIPITIDEPQPFTATKAEIDYIFRAYANDESYKKAIEALKKSELFQEKGTQEEAFLNQLLTKFHIDTAGLSPAEKISQMTYFKEVLDCETFFEGKNALSGMLSDEEKRKIGELAQWAWEKRFFLPGFEGILGGDIFKQILEELKNPHDIRFSVYSGHDYTILSLLAALKIGKYVGNCLGYGCFLLFELMESSEKGRYVRISLNSHAFEEIKDGQVKVLSEVNYHPMIIEDHITLNELEERLNSLTFGNS